MHQAMIDSGSLRIDGLRFRFPGQASDLFSIDALALAPGQTLGIRGASGAGKSTLLHCLAGIETANTGTIRWGDTPIGGISEVSGVRGLGGERLTRWRAQHVGLVFQDFHLVEGLSALDNVLLPASFSGWRASPALRRRAGELLERVGAPDRRAELLSRGERQRVAVARALLFAPPIVLADEPTASLDADNRERVGALLLDLAREQGTTLVVVSHDEALLGRLEYVVELRGGTLNGARHA